MKINEELDPYIKRALRTSLRIGFTYGVAFTLVVGLIIFYTNQ